jgi:sugar (pentulose or hexulose) kinase
LSVRCWLGLDIGTSGCRATAIDERGEVLAEAKTGLPERETPEPGTAEQDPDRWWAAVLTVLGALAHDLRGSEPAALCLDGTSATLLLATQDGQPLTPALMYNDARALAQAQTIEDQVPADSPARGPSASLAKLLYLMQTLRETSGETLGERDGPVLALHQADWVGGRLRGRFGDSDWNNALKLGYDPRQPAWPDWLLRMELGPVQLPRCHRPGSDLGKIAPSVAAATRLPASLRILAGTTDSTAAALAAGAAEPGDAVTCLGSTLVMKIVARRPIQDARCGVYSHRIGELWLAGGASNSGGAILRRFFDDAEIERLSTHIDPDLPTGLDYYPLLCPGERFPIADPKHPPRLTPRPDDDTLFLAGLFEAMARIERDAYQRLCALGAPQPSRILTTGGGACNRQWTAIRARVTGLPVETAQHHEAAYGAALVARGLQPKKSS